MLTGKHAIFIGGDARQLEVIKSFIALNARVSLIGYDNLQTPVSGASLKELTTDVLKTADILVLPIMGTDESGQVISVFTSEKLILTKEHFDALPKACVTFVGLAKPYLTELCSQQGISLIELLNRDEVAIYNSIPTVEGALMMAIQNTDITLHGSKSVVLGFGRVGMSLARTLYAIGAKVKVGVLQPKDMARAYEMSLEPFEFVHLKNQVIDAQIIFNTVPALVITEEVLTCVRHDVVIIDLASKPGGVDYLFAKKRGIKAILSPSLPGIVAPKTAGKILAQTMVQLMTVSEEVRI